MNGGLLRARMVSSSAFTRFSIFLRSTGQYYLFLSVCVTIVTLSREYFIY